MSSPGAWLLPSLTDSILDVMRSTKVDLIEVVELALHQLTRSLLGDVVVACCG